MPSFIVRWSAAAMFEEDDDEAFHFFSLPRGSDNTYHSHHDATQPQPMLRSSRFCFRHAIVIRAARYAAALHDIRRSARHLRHFTLMSPLMSDTATISPIARVHRWQACVCHTRQGWWQAPGILTPPTVHLVCTQAWPNTNVACTGRQRPAHAEIVMSCHWKDIRPDHHPMLAAVAAARLQKALPW